MRLIRFCWLALSSLLAFVACSPQATTGKLEVVVSGNPNGTTPIVRFSGAGQANVPISGIHDLAPGNYTVDAPLLEASDYNYRANISFNNGTPSLNSATGTVVAGQTTKVAVQYTASTGLVPIGVTVPNGSTPPAVSYTLKGSSTSLQTTSSNLKLDPGTYVFTPGTLPNYLAAPASIERTVVAGQKTEPVSFIYASGFGNLELVLNAPTGLAPNIQITGPNGYNNTYSSPQSLQLPPGSYTINPLNPATLEGISYTGTATPTTVTVSQGASASSTVKYVATNSSVRVNLSGMTTGDAATVTLRHSDNTGTPLTRAVVSPASGTASVRFDGVPFAAYTVSAVATRGAFDSLGATDQTITTSVNNALPTTLNFSLALRPPGQMVAGGNGNLLGSNALYSISPSDLSGSLTVLGTPFIPLSTTQYSTVPTPDIAEACYDGISRSPSRMIFDAKGNLYVVYQGKTVNLTSGCPLVYYNYATPVRRSIYLDAFILKVTPQNLAARQFYTIATRTEVGTTFADTPLTRTGDTRTIEYPVPASGNQVILKQATPTSSQSYLEDFTPANSEPGIEVSDLDFDATGNMWFSNKESGLVGCISATQLNSGNTQIRYANRVLANPYADADQNRSTKPAGVDPLLMNAFRNPSALSFDRSGNLWFTSDSWLYGGANFARLSRFNKSALTCPATIPTVDPTPETIIPDVRLDVSMSTQARALFEPSSMALSPDGNSLWIADYGSNDDIVIPTAQASLCPRTPSNIVGGVTSTTQLSCSVGADSAEETLIRVPIRNTDGSDHPNAVANTATEPLRQAVIADRIYLGNSQLQQPSAITFDASGRLWIATNNNMNVTQALVSAAVETVPQYYQPKSAFTTALRDRQGKLYGLTLPTTTNTNPVQPRAVPNPIVISADTNVGLTGLSLYLPTTP